MKILKEVFYIKNIKTKESLEDSKSVFYKVGLMYRRDKGSIAFAADLINLKGVVDSLLAKGEDTAWLEVFDPRDREQPMGEDAQISLKAKEVKTPSKQDQFNF